MSLRVTTAIRDGVVAPGAPSVTVLLSSPFCFTIFTPYMPDELGTRELRLDAYGEGGEGLVAGDEQGYGLRLDVPREDGV
ncbi:unnamed protein product [Closterium sp. NIES-54]